MQGVATPMVMAITMTTLYEKCIIDTMLFLHERIHSIE